MKTYEIRTNATMKPYNCGGWWIASDIVKNIDIQAHTINEALKKYAEFVKENAYINISKSALKNRRAMYIDTKNGAQQIGYVITASAEFEHNYNYVKQYIDLWAEIREVQNIFV